MPRSFLITLAAILVAASAPAVDGVVWQLLLTGGNPPGCQLAFTRVAKDEKGQPVLEADSRNDTGAWHTCIAVPAGLLKAGEDYTIILDYEIVQRSDDAYFYIFARSKHLGYGADRWQTWRGEPGARAVAKLRISPSTGDFGIVAGIYKQGAIRVRSMKVLHGNGLATVPLDSSAATPELPAPPTGAQPFAVDAPSNPNGPVLNLADFGATPDGQGPPSPPEADQNLVAFKAAIAKCRETKASKLIVPKGVYRIASGQTIVFAGLSDFIFDGGGATFLFDKIKGGPGITINHCTRAVFRNFNLDWDWKVDPLASVGRIRKVAPDSSFFEMHFDREAPLDPKRWVTMNPLDEKLRAPGSGPEFGGFTPTKIEKLDPQTVRVWPSRPIAPPVGRLYLLRHYTYEKHGIVMFNNAQLSLRNVTIFSFPGIGFIVSGDQHHFELLHCRITNPENERRPITTTADGFHVMQSQGFIRLEDCDFGYMGDDCINIHDNIHTGVQRMDAHTLLAKNIVTWNCPFAAGDIVEIRHGDFSPAGFTGKVKEAKPDFKNKETTLVFENELPARIDSDAILFNHRYGSRNYIIRNCYFHENRARAILCNTADGLIEGNRFFHNQFAALHLEADIAREWSEGFGARNIVIRGNTFDSSNSAGEYDGAVVYVSAMIDGSPTSYPLVENILFEKNVFRDTTGPAIVAASFKDLVIYNNSVINRQKAPVVLKMRGAIRAELGSGLWVEGNDWTTPHSIAAPAIFYDADTTRKIICQGNVLKN